MGELVGDLCLEADLALKGMVIDALTVTSGVELLLDDMVAGDLIVGSGATVTLKGMVSGAVHRSRAGGGYASLTRHPVEHSAPRLILGPLTGREAALTQNDTSLTCQAAVREPKYARRNVRWHPCTRRSRVEVIHHQDGRPIALCRQHAKIHAEDVLTPIIRWEPKAEGIAPPTTQGCAQD